MLRTPGMPDQGWLIATSVTARGGLGHTTSEPRGEGGGVAVQGKHGAAGDFR
ncbi:hypothetical protein ACF07V_34570 [Streptomyces sp. NPDC015661]|uniref:hypothetical protein n=1 Tax=Streptomyces sp. NPDC015661 TaxID=3364961 RepID=UPI0036F9846E